ncbi:MAG: hypothetical protein KYX68_01990 [Flavobacterium sp.]|nr:hypothetical protein [Flavobacterium sp.]
MKKVAFLLLFGQVFFAQEKYLVSDFNLTSDVTKYETVEYKYSEASNKFEPLKTDVLEFKDGKLLRKIHKENSAYAAIYNSNESYIYDAKGKLVKIESENRYPKLITYNSKGKISTIKLDKGSETSSISTFTYDSKGNIAKIVKKSGDFIEEETTFSDYKSPKTYHYVLKQFDSKKPEVQKKEEVWIENGTQKKFQYYGANGDLVFSHENLLDLNNNIIRTTNGTNVQNYFLGYDAKGNVLKMRSGDGTALISKFSKVTFKDGTSSGSTDFAPYFTIGVQKLVSEMDRNKYPKEKYKVNKTSPTHYDVKNSKGELVPINPNESLIFEQKDMFFYDSKTNETIVLFGLFTDAYKSNEWYEAVTYNSPTGKYIVVNTDWNFFILEKGNVAESSQYKLHKGIDGNTLVIAENGKEKFFVPHLDQMQALVIYPLELISK